MQATMTTTMQSAISGRSMSVKVEDKKLAFAQTLSYNAFKYVGKDGTTAEDAVGQFSKEKTKMMTLTNDMNETFKSISDANKVMTPRTKQREIKRITSNLPEVYNKYFFTQDKDGVKHM